MALTQGEWTQQHTTLSGMKVWKCNVAFTTAEHDAYTLKTPSLLDTSKAWMLLMSGAAAPDGTTLPVDLWGGYTDSFSLSGDNTSVAATDGFKIKQILDDCQACITPLVYGITFDPILPVADVVAVASIGSGLKVRIPVLPYYVINLNGGGTLNATNCDFYIIQYDN
jgi:hypothetical protein